jgi:hypothetical protein
VQLKGFRFWTEEEYSALAESLNIDKLSEEARYALEVAHRHFAADLEKTLSRPASAKRSLKKIQKHIHSLNKALHSLNEEMGTIDELAYQELEMVALESRSDGTDGTVNKSLFLYPPPPREWIDSLLVLESRIGTALLKCHSNKDRGADDVQWPIRTLINRLAMIYKDVTGHPKATQSKGIDNSPGGPFFKMVKAFLEIAGHKTHSDIALSRQIDQVIYSNNSEKNPELM